MWNNRKYITLICALCVGLLITSVVNAAPEKAKQSVAATVSGQAILLDDLNSPEISKLRQELYEQENKQLQTLAVARLRLEKPGEFPPPNVKVTKAEIEAVYKQAGLEEKGSLESYRTRIYSYVEARKIAEYATTQFQLGIAKGYIKTMLKAPPPFLFRAAVVNRNSEWGPRNAPVQIIEFSDFQ